MWHDCVNHIDSNPGNLVCFTTKQQALRPLQVSTAPPPLVSCEQNLNREWRVVMEGFSAVSPMDQTQEERERPSRRGGT